VHSEKSGFFKKPNPLGLLGFGLYWVIWIFYLNKQLRSLLVDLAHYLSFHLNLPVPKNLNLQIHCLLVIRCCKHEEILIITGVTN